MKKIISVILTAAMLFAVLSIGTSAAGTLIFSDDFENGIASRNWGSGSAYKWDSEQRNIYGYRDAVIFGSNYNKKFKKAWDQYYVSMDIQVRGFDNLEEEEVAEHTLSFWYQDWQVDREYNDNADMNVDHKATYWYTIVIETGEVELKKVHTFKYQDEHGITQDGSIDSVIATGKIDGTIGVGDDAEWINMGMRVTSGKIECYFNEKLVCSSSSEQGKEKLGEFFVDAVDTTVGEMYSAFIFMNGVNYLALDNFEVWTPDYDFQTSINYGDVNGDGKVNMLDATAMLQSLADWTVDGFVSGAADTNGDGKFNLNDVTRLLQYIADWDVTLGPVAE